MKLTLDEYYITPENPTILFLFSNTAGRNSTFSLEVYCRGIEI
jgi:hypothetical protein